MTELLFVILGGALGGAVLSQMVLHWRQRRHPARARRVIVNFTTLEADAIRGVLLRHEGEWLVLAKPELVREGETLPMDGEVVLERGAVLFLQVLP